MNYSFKSKLKMYINSSVVLIFFTVVALACANIPGVKEWYAAIWSQEVSLSVGKFNFFSHHGHAITLGQMINDFLMAIFFLSVGLEIKRELGRNVGLVIGKFAGVFSFSWIAVRMGIVSLPTGATWKSFASVCVVCGIGFTVSMFISELSYAGLEDTATLLLPQAKLGVLCGSVISALLGCYLLNKTLPRKR